MVWRRTTKVPGRYSIAGLRNIGRVTEKHLKLLLQLETIVGIWKKYFKSVLISRKDAVTGIEIKISGSEDDKMK